MVFSGYSVTVEYSIKTTCGTKEEIPFDNAGLDCRYMQCREDPSKPSEVVSNNTTKNEMFSSSKKNNNTDLIYVKET